ncbi:lysozyme [Pseudomonas gingeri]|uniref:Lysozyme n=1 Tax=Pseudomonas gingeri TaxID=117681 RepID=A0A7Y8C235_9PSED|nr:lysozyme [Pseudomonas gingeri]NWA29033.1 lysozyme [Pseudomonas gingeri]NWB97155.1 lysozyme [Pseudomonas gingeri]NWD66107.1 lysozyme [Pseudomonas gingeri]NWD73527.1 lysozyme [Pseudomonas gingeri]
MKTSPNGIAVLKYFESCRLTAYPDPASGGAPWTIGWGHTGPEVTPGLVWTQEQADSQLTSDLVSREQAVSKAVTVPLTQGQFDALVDFVYNLGAGNFQTSTLLSLINAEDMAGAVEQFARWNKAGGKVMAGLTRRRAAEAALFTGSSGADAIAAGVAAA